MNYYVGCDLGGTNIKVGVVDVDEGKVLFSKNAPTLAHELEDAVMTRMAALINDVIEESGVGKQNVQGIGVSAPGLLDTDKGIVLFLTNLQGHWPNVPLADTLQQACGLPVWLLNDVRAITLGEYTFGAGRGVDNMACFAIGTGIGGGIVVCGKLVLGIDGSAGEIGHQTIDFNGPRCNCGNYGCLETFASGPAIASAGIKAVKQGHATLIGELAGFDLNKITPKLIAKAAEQGDPIAKEIWRDAGHYLGVGIGNVIVTIAPRRIVLSGGVAEAGELLLKPVRKTLKKSVFLVPLDEVEVVLGELGNEAGVLGMAQWAYLKNTGKHQDCV